MDRLNLLTISGNINFEENSIINEEETAGPATDNHGQRPSVLAMESDGVSGRAVQDTSVAEDRGLLQGEKEIHKVVEV